MIPIPLSPPIGAKLLERLRQRIQRQNGLFHVQCGCYVIVDDKYLCFGVPCDEPKSIARNSGRRANEIDHADHFRTIGRLDSAYLTQRPARQLLQG